MRAAIRRALQRLRENPLDLLIIDLAWPPRTRSISQPVQATLTDIASPHPDRGQRHVSLGGNLCVRRALGGTQNNPCARRLLLGHRWPTQPRAKLLLLARRQLNHASGTRHATNVPELAYNYKLLPEHCTRDRTCRALAARGLRQILRELLPHDLHITGK